MFEWLEKNPHTEQIMDQNEIRERVTKLNQERVAAEEVIIRVTAELQGIRNICKHPGVPQHSASRTISPMACPDCLHPVFLSTAGRVG